MKIRVKFTPIVIVFIGHMLAMVSAGIVISEIIMIGLFTLSAFHLLKGNNKYFWAMLLLGAYNSNFPNVYTLNIGPLSSVYFLIIIFIFLHLKDVLKNKFRKEIFLFVLPFLLLYPIQIFLGFINRYSYFLFFVDVFSFSSFLFFIFYAITISKNNLIEILDYIKKYLMLVYPVFIIFSTIIRPGDPTSLYFDEFSKLHAIGIIPIIYLSTYSRKTKLLVALINIVAILLIAFLGYFSSLNFILISLSSIFILFKLHRRTLVMTILVVILLAPITLSQIYIQLSSQTKFKVSQVSDTIEELIAGKIEKVPFSPKIRLLEIMNSYAELKEFPLYLITGKGYGSFFTYKYYPNHKYGIATLVAKDAYEEASITRNQYPRGHGFYSYSLIKIGVVLVFVMTIIGLLAFFIKEVQFQWLSISVPFYILTTFGFGYKNFVFVGLFVGIILLLLSEQLLIRNKAKMSIKYTSDEPNISC